MKFFNHTPGRVKVQHGQTLGEYALVLFSIAVAAAAGYFAFGDAVLSLMDRVVSSI